MIATVLVGKKFFQGF